MLGDLRDVEDNVLFRVALFVAPPVVLGVVLATVVLEVAAEGAIIYLVLDRVGVLEVIGEQI